LMETAKAIFFDRYADDGAMKLLNEWKPAHATPLVQIDAVQVASEDSTLQGCFRRLGMSTQTQEAAKIEQLAHENPDEIEVAAGREREQLEGWVPALASDAEVREALEKAFDYRGDITITRKDAARCRDISSIGRTARRWGTHTCD